MVVVEQLTRNTVTCKKETLHVHASATAAVIDLDPNDARRKKAGKLSLL